ncbi:MAG: hypothetical protein JJT90_18595 [Ectothiorhodospiraceae bacterium]|nr:hypothetical protein [Ectothiorhodospiraceae bacterium]
MNGCTRPAFVALALFPLTVCATAQVPQSGFLDEYDVMERSADGRALSPASAPSVGWHEAHVESVEWLVDDRNHFSPEERDRLTATLEAALQAAVSPNTQRPGRRSAEELEDLLTGAEDGGDGA